MTPALIDFQSIQIIHPKGYPSFTSKQWSEIQSAMILASNDRTRSALYIVNDLEERLGVRDAHRITALGGELALKAHIKRRNEQTKRFEYNRTKQLNAPWKPPTFDQRELARIDRKLKSNDPRQLKEAKSTLVDMEEARQARAESLRTAAEQAEIQRQAEHRSDPIVVETDKTKGVYQRARFINRDGLESLLKSGHITRRQFDAGMRYRDLYERTDDERSLKPMEYGAIHAPHHGGEGYARKRCQWVHERLNIEAAVTNDAKNKYALPALMETAGNRRYVCNVLNDRGKNGHVREQYVKGLVEALDIAAKMMGM
jgi:hypothetical protein